jgi:hypothetical protein
MLSILAGRRSCLAWVLAFSIAAWTEVAGGQVMLAQNARVTLTRADYETELARRVPEDHRAEFAGSPQRIAELLNLLLVRKTLAAEAREAGLDREPLGEGAGVDEDTILSQRLLAKLDAEARADFDRRIEGFTAKAREDYLVNRQNYVAPEQIELSQIFLDVEKRGDEEALRIAGMARARLSDGADFAALAREVSDDAESAAKGGRVVWTRRTRLDPTLARTVSAMKQIGEISDVVRTQNGYTIVRLDGKRPARQQTFDEAKDRILTQLRQDHVDASRTAKADAIVADPKLRVNQPAIDALVIDPAPEAVRRALQAVPPGPPPN